MNTKYDIKVTANKGSWTPMERVKILDDLVYRYKQALYFGKKELMEEIISDTRDYLSES